MPTCFVCGPDRAPGDGLRIFAGAADGFEGVADIWTPDGEWADEDGLVRPEILWAALDCPSAFAILDADSMMLLGRITARIHERPKPGAPLIIAGWSKGSEGRKHFAGAALYREDGTLIAQSDTLWIALKA